MVWGACVWVFGRSVCVMPEERDLFLRDRAAPIKIPRFLGLRHGVEPQSLTLDQVGEYVRGRFPGVAVACSELVTPWSYASETVYGEILLLTSCGFKFRFRIRQPRGKPLDACSHAFRTRVADATGRGSNLLLERALLTHWMVCGRKHPAVSPRERQDRDKTEWHDPFSREWWPACGESTAAGVVRQRGRCALRRGSDPDSAVSADRGAAGIGDAGDSGGGGRDAGSEVGLREAPVVGDVLGGGRSSPDRGRQGVGSSEGVVSVGGELEVGGVECGHGEEVQG